MFEFRCEACSQATEVIVLAGEDPPTACEACGGELRRLWSRIGVQLVGWGFAKNDAMLPDDRKRRSFHEIRDKAAELFD